MPEVRLLNERDLRELVRLDAELVAAIERCFEALASGNVVMPDVLSMEIAEYNGEVDVKTAYLPGIDNFALKVSPGFFDNPQLGLASLNGLMIVLSAKTGLLEAMLLDNGYLTAMRTAAAGAVAAKWLAREDSEQAGVIGAGEQARLQLEALTLVRPIRRARVWAPRPEKAEEFAKEMAESLGLEVTPVAAAEDAVRGSDIVVTATPSRRPLVHGDWLEPGVHLTAMGSDAPHKNELEPGALARADRYVADRLSQCRRLGELHHAVAAGVVPEDSSFPELGEVIRGSAVGRTGPEQVTIADLTGTGAQDTAIAALALTRAVAGTNGAGSKGSVYEA